MRYIFLTAALLFSGVLNASDPILCAEITNDPLSRGYVAMTNAEVTADLNIEYRIIIKDSMTGTEIFQAVDSTEFLALAVADRDLIMQFFSWTDINPAGNEADIFTSIFGGGSATISALILARQQLISRANELGLSRVLEGYVEECEGR